MSFEDQLHQAWQTESGGRPNLAGLTARVRRQQRQRWLQRIVEALLTVAAVALFAHALLAQAMGPAHWLLLPFFAVFLPTAWLLTLRGPKPDAETAIAATEVYARIRLAQLKTSLRDLRLARRAAQGLIIYALLAGLGAWTFGDAAWHDAALWLLSYATAWLAATLLLTRRLGRRRHDELSNLRDLIGE
jgi:hypothetical protein